MLIVDAQVHLWAGGTPLANHRQIPSYSADDLLKEMDESDKCIAAICHGPWILVSAGILEGRKITAYQSIRADIQNAGAEYVDAPLVVDGNLISAPHYRNNPEFLKATVEYFNN